MLKQTRLGALAAPAAVIMNGVENMDSETA
jgi:hypothetical protein